MILQIRKAAAIFLSFLLISCGGGGGSSTSASPPSSTGADVATGSNAAGDGTGTPPPASSLTITADKNQTTAGGGAVTLTAPDGQAGEWSLPAGSLGSLDRSSGNTVRYLPPPSVTTDTLAVIICTVGDVSASVKILVTSGASSNAGTAGAGSTTQPLPSAGSSSDGSATTPELAPGVYLVAGNDYGPGVADGTGTAARFNGPSAAAMDAQGNLYVADAGNFTVRRIAKNGVVTTYAGTPGTRGYVDGPAASAQFSSITGIAVDNAGNVFVSDSDNRCIRKITPDGVVSTFAGSPAGTEFSYGIAGLAFDANGTLFVANGGRVMKVAKDGSVATVAGGNSYVNGPQDGPAATASFSGLQGIAVDAAGNIYVSEADWVPMTAPKRVTYMSSSIRKISASGTVSTIAGTTWKAVGGGVGWVSTTTGETWDGQSFSGAFRDGPGAQALFYWPAGLAIDRAGNLFVADRGSAAVRRVTPDGVVGTAAGVPGHSGSDDGNIDTAHLAPTGITTGPDGILYVTEWANHTVRKITLGSNVTTVAGAAPKAGSTDGARGTALFKDPTGLRVDASGNLYLADSGNATIRKISPDGVVTTIAGIPGHTGADNGPAASATFNYPQGLALAPSGDIYVADAANQVVRRISSGGTVSTFAGVVGQSSEADRPPFNTFLGGPTGTVMDKEGTLFVSTSISSTLKKLAPDGALSTLAGIPEGGGWQDGTGADARLLYPRQMDIDAAGNLYVVDGNSSIVRKVTPAGVVTTLAGAYLKFGAVDGPSGQSRFNYVGGIAVAPDGNVYVGDAASIRKISPSGVMTTVAGVGGIELATGSIYRPTSIAVTGPKTLTFTSGNGVFKLKLP